MIIKASIPAAVLAMATVAATHPAAAASRHHRFEARRDGTVVEQRSAAQDAPAQPQWERDGVPGNDAFNNQLRKFSDPLGAHGGR